MSNDAIAAALARVRSQFLEQADERLAPLRAACAVADSGHAVDWASVHENTHKIAGLAGTVGLPAISDAARELEALVVAHTRGEPVAEQALRAALRGVLSTFERAQSDAA